MKSSDILVIGAGINGLASALALSKAGFSVRIIDTGSVGRESSWAGAGILAALPPWGYSPQVTDLIDYSVNLWPDWLADIGAHSTIDPEFITSGMLVLDPENQPLARAWCEAHGETQVLPENLLHLSKNRTAFWLPQISQARNPRLLGALKERVIAANIAILPNTGALAWHHAGRRIESLQTTQGPLKADRYIVAAGAWSTTVLGELALGLSVRPIRGQIVLLKGEPGQVPCIILSGTHYLVPRRDGHVLIGSTLEDVGFNKNPDLATREPLQRIALELFPELQNAPLAHHWAGLRPGSPGNIPSIGVHPNLENLYINAGHFRYGVTMAPAAAQILTDMILERDSTLETTPYAWPTHPSEHPIIPP